MSQRKSLKQQEGRLAAIARAKAAQLRKLEAEHSRLKYQHDLLVAVCDCLAWCREQQQSGDPAALANSQGLVAAEEQLLEELRGAAYCGLPARPLSAATALGKPGSVSAAADAAAASPAAAQEAAGEGPAPAPSSSGSADDRLAPEGDMLCVVRWVLAQRPFPGAEHLTLQWLCSSYMQTVKEAALALHQLDQCMPANGGQQARVSPLARIQAAFMRHWNVLATLTSLQRDDMVASFCLANCETGELLQQPPMEVHRFAVRRLQLQPEQQEQIVQGLAVFRRLLMPVLQEMQQLQQAGAGSGDSSERGSASATSSLAELFGGVGAHEQQQRQLARLRALQRKDWLLKTMMFGHQLGILTWRQLAQVVVHATPYVPSTAPFATAVQELLLETKGTRAGAK